MPENLGLKCLLAKQPVKLANLVLQGPKEALEHATGSKKQLRLPPSLPKDGSR